MHHYLLYACSDSLIPCHSGAGCVAQIEDVEGPGGAAVEEDPRGLSGDGRTSAGTRRLHTGSASGALSAGQLVFVLWLCTRRKGGARGTRGVAAHPSGASRNPQLHFYRLPSASGSLEIGPSSCWGRLWVVLTQVLQLIDLGYQLYVLPRHAILRLPVLT